MENYVLRIYRQKKNKPESIVGVLHDFRNHAKRPFKGLAELCSILLAANCARKSGQKTHQNPTKPMKGQMDNK